MNQRIYLHFVLLILLSMGISSCNVQVEAAFELQLDPVIPGKVNAINHSANATRYEWELWMADSEFGTPYTGSSYYHQYDSENPSFYMQEDTWIYVTLRAMNGIGEDSYEQWMYVGNVPDQVTIGDLVITHINYRDVTDNEWDDLDGTSGFGDYSNPTSYPDLLVNEDIFYVGNYEDNAVQYWDLNFETGLPVAMVTEAMVFDNLGPQTDDYFIELVDFDGNPGSMFFGPGKRMGSVSFNPYHLTHKYNKGSPDNYPAVYKVVTENFEADLYLNWD